MPVYEYRCDKCEHEFEREQRITEDPVKTCPECRARKVRRLISQTSFVLKGGGWYNDLYSSSKGKRDSGSDGGDSKSDAKSDSKSDAKSDSKSDSKPDAKSSSKSGDKGKGKSGKKPTKAA
ncbi:MAG: zinc ribbon domain-containing protein [Proteobacteria bacterium]|nr:zinc ribbon domain-containing protein [Pseudomonadota bacterium]